MIELTTQNFDQLLKENKKVIVDLYATWCGPCQMLGIELDRFDKKNTGWTIIRVDVEKFPQLAQGFNANAVPTIAFIVDEKIKEIIQGYRPETEIIKITQKY